MKTMLKRAGAPAARTRPRNIVYPQSSILLYRAPAKRARGLPGLASRRHAGKLGGASRSGVEMKGPGFLQRPNSANTGMAGPEQATADKSLAGSVLPALVSLMALIS